MYGSRMSHGAHKSRITEKSPMDFTMKETFNKDSRNKSLSMANSRSTNKAGKSQKIY